MIRDDSLKETNTSMTKQPLESECVTDETYEKSRLEALHYAFDSAKEGIKACIFINGGAAGALLVFMGHLATVGNDRLIRSLVSSLIPFGLGLVVGIGAHGAAYASNLNFARDPQGKKWKIYRRWTVGVTLLSILLFAVGGYYAYRAFFEGAIQIKLKVSDNLELREDLEKTVR